ncbi:MAG: HTTM domain-containing protein [Anaerolineales bacterium]|nr:HTTM domain-containing protein [Anaerolineales bacterium]
MTAIKTWLAQPTSIIPLVGFRVAFGVLMLVSTLRFWLKGWIAEYYIDPTYHFTYWGFGWVKPLPAIGMYLVFAMVALLCVFITIGLAYHLSMALFFVLFTYIELLDKAFYLNHYYFISLLSFMLIFIPLHRQWSVDSWWRPVIRTTHVPRWTITVIQLQIGIVYVFAGIAKLNPDWLLRAMPLAIWLPAYTDFPLIGHLFEHRWVAYTMSWGGALYDLTIPFWLSWRRTRWPAYATVVFFHVMTGLLFPIGMFPWIMLACTLIFFDGHDYRKLLRWLPTPTPPITPISIQPSRWGVAILGLFFLFQIGLPLRHWLYTGNVLWTEEGYRLSWRVMLVEKAGFTTFFVHDPTTGREWVVYPSQYLTPQQTQQMSFQPDMIQAFAHHLREVYQAKGYAAVEVRAEAYVSWNGRSSHLLVDPQTNLAAEPRSLWHKPWITDAPPE